MVITEEQKLCADFVKEATKKLHAETEALLLPTIKGARTTSDYIRLLHLFYGFYAPLEPILDQFVDAGTLPDWQERRKASLLLDDLKSLGAPTPGMLCADLPPVAHLYDALGILYVLEGSTLGGTIIARMLQQRIGLEPEALRFFNGYGAENEVRWAMFKQVLNRYANNEEKIAMVTKAANSTFRSLKDWILNF